MQLRTITRLTALATVVLVVGGVVATVVAPSASARPQQRLTLNPDQTVSVDYPGLVGSGQAQELVDPATAFDPGVCAEAAVTFCDTIPLTIAPPVTDLAHSDYIILIKLVWDTKVQEVPVYGPVSVNDLDMAIWDDPIVDGAGPNEDGIRTYAATGNEPEQMSMVDASGNFNIVVLNAGGVNKGYHLDITWTTQLIQTPFESLPPDFSTTGSLTPPSSHLALGGGNVAAPAPAPITSGNVLPPLASPAIADASFGAVQAPDFKTAIANKAVATATPASAKRDLSPPSNLALLLWLLALPFGLTAIGGQILLGRSRALLRI